MPDLLSLRDATINDMETIFRWRNDPWIISLGSSGKPVSPEEHQNWYNNALNDNDICISIIQISGEDAGQVRFSRIKNDIAVVTIYLMKDFTGKGYGTQVLKNACADIFKKWSLKKIEAYIQDDNSPSITAFAKSGFKESQSPSEQHKKHVCYELCEGDL